MRKLISPIIILLLCSTVFFRCNSKADKSDTTTQSIDSAQIAQLAFENGFKAAIDSLNVNGERARQALIKYSTTQTNTQGPVHFTGEPHFHSGTLMAESSGNTNTYKSGNLVLLDDAASNHKVLGYAAFANVKSNEHDIDAQDEYQGNDPPRPHKHIKVDFVDIEPLKKDGTPYLDSNSKPLRIPVTYNLKARN